MGSSKVKVVLRIGLYALLFCLSALYIGLGITRALNIYDEGLILYDAQRVLWGQVPYRDFWTVYSPGQFYILAGLFKVFGSTILVERIWDTLFRAALALAGFAIVRRLSSGFFGLLAWLLISVWLGFYEFYGYPVYIALFLIIISILALLGVTRSIHPRRTMFWAGLTLGAAALFRHDFGVYGLLTEVVVFTPLVLTGIIALPDTSRGKSLVTLGVPYIVGAALLVVPAVVLLLVAVPFQTLWYDLITFTTQVFPLVRALPYPELNLSNWPYYLPYLVAGITALVLIIGIIQFRRRGFSSEQAVRLSGLAYLILFAAASINQSRIRADLIHLVGLLIISFILGFALVGMAWRSWKPAGFASLLVALVLLIPFYRLVLDERVRLFERGIWADTPNTNHRIPAAWGMPVDPDQAAAVRYIRDHTTVDTPLYVATSRHDRIFVNDALFYFLAGRPSATRYNELHPGVATTQKVQDEIVADLERLKVPFVVRFSML
ncbi:MAG: hypothetical protein ACYC6L_14065 [Anaerolineae bacterium]